MKTNFTRLALSAFALLLGASLAAAQSGRIELDDFEPALPEPQIRLEVEPLAPEDLDAPFLRALLRYRNIAEQTRGLNERWRSEAAQRLQRLEEVLAEYERELLLKSAAAGLLPPESEAIELEEPLETLEAPALDPAQIEQSISLPLLLPEPARSNEPIEQQGSAIELSEPLAEPLEPALETAQAVAPARHEVAQHEAIALENPAELAAELDSLQPSDAQALLRRAAELEGASHQFRTTARELRRIAERIAK